MDVAPRKSLEVVAIVRPLVLDCDGESPTSALRVIGSQLHVQAGVERSKSEDVEETFSFDRCLDGDAAANTANAAIADSNPALHMTAIRARCDEQLFWEQTCWRDAIKKREDACVIAYGQQKSGKSHALLGGPGKAGLVKRVADDLLNSQVADLRLRFSALDLTPDEELRDMLSPSATGSASGSGRASTRTPLAIVEHPALGVHIAGLSEVACNSAKTLEELVHHCQRQRAASASSRGFSAQTHSLYMLRMQSGGSSSSKAGLNETPAPISHASFMFADLVGSDAAPLVGADAAGVLARRAAGAKPLNGGLFSLHQAVRALSEGKRHNPTSKLTQLLGGGLSGNIWTTFIATLSPAWSDLEESRRTLRFSEVVARLPAATVAQCRAPKQDHMVERLQEQVQQLRAQLKATLDQLQAEVLTRTIESWDWILERHRRSVDALELSELEAAHRRRGMLTRNSTNVDGAPYLSNLSSDAQLRGVLIFPLRSSPAQTGLVTVGSQWDCSIVLCGVGIPPRLCEISVCDGDEVTIRMIDESYPCRCTVNGGLVRRGSEAKVEHGDRLIFGWSHVFQVCAPDRAERLGLPSFTGFLTEEHALQELNASESDIYSVLVDYVEDIRGKMSEDDFAKFLEILKEACYYVDEANEITRDMRPDLEQKFDIDFVWDMFRRVQDVIVIRIMQRTPSDEADHDSMVLFYWTFPRFCERLFAMRAAYNTFLHDGTWELASNPFEDPWMEASLLEFREKLHAEKAVAKPELFSKEEANGNADFMVDSLPTEPLAVVQKSESAHCISQEAASTRNGRTNSAGRLAQRQGIGRGKTGTMGLRCEQRRAGTGVGSSTSGSLSAPRGADGGSSSVPIGDTDKSESLNFDRAGLSARREIDRSSSPVETQGRHAPNHNSSLQMGLEVERLRREAQRHSAEMRRLRADAQQNEKQKKLQDQLIESLRSQLEDKTELVSTLRVIVQDRTAKCEELTRAEVARNEAQVALGKVESLQSTAASGSFQAPMGKAEGMQSSCSSLPTSLPTPTHETGMEEVAPSTAAPSTATASPVSAAFTLPGAGSAPSGVASGCAPAPVTWSDRNRNFSPRGGSLKGKLTAFVCERQPLSPTEEVNRILESPQSPRPAGSPVTMHTVETMALREPPTYRGSSLVVPPAPGSVPMVAREGGRPLSPSQQQQQLIRVASPTISNISRTPTQGQVYRPARAVGLEQKQWAARVVAPAVPISRTTPPRTSVGYNSTPRRSSPKAMPVRAVAWSATARSHTPPRADAQERVIRPRSRDH